MPFYCRICRHSLKTLCGTSPREWTSSMNGAVCSSFLPSTTIVSSPGLKEWACRHFLLLFSGYLGHRLPPEMNRYRALGLNESMWCCNQRLRPPLNLSPLGGFRNIASILTLISVRATLQFTRGETPSAELAVWACVIPHGTLRHFIYLGCNSFMRCEQRT